ncbi:MAG: SGNH/GDSL hydrolase family protein [Symploca sp. SIO2G7]|nr:SGNH/GDSL hydrolase family protein [Symploca sp. SIO2G7]
MEKSRVKIALVILVVIVGLLVITELLLRSLVGFGNPLIYITDPDIGYLLAPSQRTRRFGNLIAINEYSMRSPTITVTRPKSTLRILILGDSVANGAWWTDQQETISALLETQLVQEGRRQEAESSRDEKIFTTMHENQSLRVPASPRPRVSCQVEVLNASANSWGPRNELAYLKKFGTFEAQVVVLLINTDDLFAAAPNSAPVGRDRNYPDRKPSLALAEVFTRYLLPKGDSRVTPTAPEKDPVGSNLKAIEQIQTYSNSNAAEFVLLMTPLLREISQPGSRDYELQARARLNKFTKDQQITYLDFLPVFKESETPEAFFRDHIHLSSQGNQKITEAIKSLSIVRSQMREF